MTNLNNRKGDAIRILTSKYKECDAWIDTGKKNTRCKVPVIIETDEGLKSTRIDKENVTTPFELPVLYEEAAFQQKPEMDLLADQLMKKLARCNITSSDEIVRILMGKLDKANAVQAAKGSRARWEHVEWENGWQDDTNV